MCAADVATEGRTVEPDGAGPAAATRQSAWSGEPWLPAARGVAAECQPGAGPGQSPGYGRRPTHDLGCRRPVNFEPDTDGHWLACAAATVNPRTRRHRGGA